MKSNYIAGKGRWDVAISPPESKPDLYAVIMEFKILYGDESLSDAAISGLAQINETKYRAGLSQHISKLLELGIAFQGTSSHVVFRTLEKRGTIWHEIK